MDPTLAAVVGGLVGGFFAAVVSGFVTLRAQNSQHDFDLRSAHVERLQRRREIAYEKILSQAYRLSFWVERTLPVISFTGDRPPPDPSPDEEIIALNATTAAHASPKVIEAVHELGQAHRIFSADAWQVQFERDHPHPSQDGASTWAEMDRARQKFRDALETLSKTINAELTSSQND